VGAIGAELSDPDDSWQFSDLQPGATTFKLADGLTFHWDNRDALTAGVATSLRFRVLETNGSPQCSNRILGCKRTRSSRKEAGWCSRIFILSAISRWPHSNASCKASDEGRETKPGSRLRPAGERRCDCVSVRISAARPIPHLGAGENAWPDHDGAFDASCARDRER
jgi:hypothetical protein